MLPGPSMQHSRKCRRTSSKAAAGAQLTRALTQVYIHLTVSTDAGEVLHTTRPDLEGTGIPVPFVIGKGMRAPRGWELAVTGVAPSAVPLSSLDHGSDKRLAWLLLAMVSHTLDISAAWT